MLYSDKPQRVPANKFTYEIILSKGYGKLTKNAEKMMIDLATNAIRKKASSYKCVEDKEEAIQTGLFNMLNMWHNFNPDKSENSFAYFTEVFLRGTAESQNLLYNKKGLKPEEQYKIKQYSLDRMNQGEGMHNV